MFTLKNGNSRRSCGGCHRRRRHGNSGGIPSAAGGDVAAVDTWRKDEVVVVIYRESVDSHPQAERRGDRLRYERTLQTGAQVHVRSDSV